MWSAVLWGAISGSAVLIGALLALFLPIPSKLIGFIMAFGTGVLIGAAAYELLDDSANEGGLIPTVIGFTAGALVFTLFDGYISRKGGAGRKRSVRGTKNTKIQNGGSGLAIFAGGGIISMVSSSMMPEAYEDGGPLTGLVAAMGMLCSLILDHL